jgi:hypothetical protein
LEEKKMRRSNPSSKRIRSQNRDYQRKMFNKLSNMLKITTQEQWYRVTSKQAKARIGTSVLQHYNMDIKQALPSVYHEFTWYKWKFHPQPISLWADMKTQQEYMDSLMYDMNISTQEECYSFQMDSYTGKSLLQHYKNDMYSLFQSVYPQFRWQCWMFSTVSNQALLRDREIQFEYLEHIAELNNFIKQEDWYGIRSTETAVTGINTDLLKVYDESISLLLSTVYPQYVWYPWLFKAIPDGYWNSIQNRRFFFQWLAEELHIEREEQWYNVSLLDIKRTGGGRMLQVFYHDSFIAAIQDIYPDYEWLPWRFKTCPRGYWNKRENILFFLNYLSKKLDVRSIAEWKEVPRAMIVREGGGALLKKFGGIQNLLQYLYPGTLSCTPCITNKVICLTGSGDTKVKYVGDSTAKTEQRLFNVLRGLLKTEILKCYLHPQLCYPDSEEKMQLDIFVPSLDLAFEYQVLTHCVHKPDI